MDSAYAQKFLTNPEWKDALDALYDMKALSQTKLNLVQKAYLEMARARLGQLRDEVPLIEASIRVNEVLDYLYYVE